MKRSCSAWLLALTFIVAGCSSSGGSPDQHYRSDGQGLVIGANAAFDLGFRPHWASDLKLPGSVDLVAAVVLDDQLITVTSQRVVTAISIRTGKPMWNVQIGTELENLYAPIRFENSIYVNSQSTMYELDPMSGDIRSSGPLDETVIDGPMLVDDKAMFGTVNGTIYAHSLITGRYRWKYKLTSRIATRPISVGLNVFAADIKGTYIMIDASTGNPSWQGRTFGAVTVPPAYDRTSLYIACNDTFLYALDRATGQDKWKYPAAAALTQAPMAIGTNVYLPVPGKGLVALDTVDGNKPRWVINEQIKPVTGKGDNLLALAAKQLLLIEADSGRIVRRVPTNDPVARTLIGPDDSLILISPRGRMIRLDPV
ncbi:MAG: PQQ-like beta-propeller repeat protein [Phycisphaeraceae bacterium]|nr:PQQ-like beta-propeller repeat protein [Phycisphaeraceae bacterium]